MNHVTAVHHVDHTTTFSLSGMIPSLILSSFFCLLLLLYIGAVIFTNRRYKRWPLHRTVCWSIGTLLALIAVIGPVSYSESDFTTHMLSHLLLGMLAPLLMVIAAPVTLLLRTLSTPKARRLSALLKSWPSRIVTHPIFASIMNIGGLFVLYTTELFALMHTNGLIEFIVHFHVFIAGYLFTVSIIYFDPIPHRKSFLYRAIVFILALASHGILAKVIYGYPPVGVPSVQAELGAQIMYYGGDVIDAVIIIILCSQWFKATKPRDVLTKQLDLTKGNERMN